MRYFILGCKGMAGHLIAHYLLEQGEDVEGLAMSEASFCKTHVMDATRFDQLEALIRDNRYDCIINCIGILNQAAEDNKDKAVLLNAYLPHFLANVTKDLNTKVIHMSTDCVFSGKKGHYTECDTTDGETFYDRSKALGEINDDKNLTFRNSIIGPDINENGIGLFNWFMKQKGEINGYEKSKWTGVTTLTLAKAMHRASYEGLTGLYNLVNNEVTNKYELLRLFNTYSKKGLTIHRVDGVVHDKSLYRTREGFSFTVPSYEEQVKDMFAWIEVHRALYPHYFE